MNLPRTMMLCLLLGVLTGPRAQVQCALETAELNGPDPSNVYEFGFSVAIDGDLIAVGVPLDDDGGFASGSVSLFRRQGSLWPFEAELRADDAAAGDQFAVVAVSGGRVFVGALADSNVNGSAAGAVYVFEKIGPAWVQTAKLLAPGPSAGFGQALDVDGDTLVVGSPDNPGGGTGAAYVFRETGGIWTLEDTLAAPGVSGEDAYGISVAVAGDLAVVGASGTLLSTGRAFVFQRSGSTWTLAQELGSGSLIASDLFGSAVAVSDQQILIGAPGDTDDPTGPGKVYVFARTAGLWEEQGLLTPAVGEPADLFGFSLAADGDRALVGMIRRDQPATRNGAVSVFRRGQQGIWTEVAALTAADAASNAAYGFAVDLDADTGVVGALFGEGGTANSGSAYVVTIPEPLPGIVELDKFNGSDEAAGDEYGSHIGLSDQRMIVTAPLNRPAGIVDAGAAYVYHDALSDRDFQQEAKLVASDPSPSALFGFTAALKSDTAIVGAPQRANLAGAAYVFVNGAGGWAQQAILTPADLAAGDRFGLSVALCNDIAVIGARYDDHQGVIDSGSAYVFQRDNGIWTERAKLVAGDFPAGGQIGYVAASCDTILVGGTRAATGCPSDPDCIAGAVYVFRRVGDSWSQTQKLTADIPTHGDFFGFRIEMFNDVAVVGAPFEDTPAGVNAGAAYVFRDVGGNWQQEAKLGASDAGAGAEFGLRVAIYADTIAVPARKADDACSPDPDCDSGAVYVYRYDGSGWPEVAKLVATDADQEDWFGQHVALQGNLLAVGSVLDDDAGADSGSAYLYDLAVDDCGTLAADPDEGGCTPLPELVSFSGFEDP